VGNDSTTGLDIAKPDQCVVRFQQAGFDGIYSLHSEYKGRHSFKDLDTEACLEQTAKDLAFFKGVVD